MKYQWAKKDNNNNIQISRYGIFPRRSIGRAMQHLTAVVNNNNNFIINITGIII